jgi:hypothetical protein
MARTLVFFVNKIKYITRRSREIYGVGKGMEKKVNRVYKSETMTQKYSLIPRKHL